MERETTGTGPIYDYHLRDDLDVGNPFYLFILTQFDVNTADYQRRHKPLLTKIGLESRVSTFICSSLIYSLLVTRGYLKTNVQDPNMTQRAWTNPIL